MRFEPGPLAGLVIVHPTIFGDARGSFQETYHVEKFAGGGIADQFVQDNQAFSYYGAVRGLHFQAPPYAQAKLIRALSGTIRDVVVDVRPASSTYGQYFAIDLSAENGLQLYVPHGFAHGYSVLSATAVVLYKCDNLYHKASEGGIHPIENGLNIDWGVPTDSAVLSEKDQLLPSLSQLKSPF